MVKNEFESSFKWFVAPVHIWNYMFRIQENTTYMSDKVILNIDLKRIDATYNIVFYTPLLGKSTLFFARPSPFLKGLVTATFCECNILSLLVPFLSYSRGWDFVQEHFDPIGSSVSAPLSCYANQRHVFQILW